MSSLNRGSIPQNFVDFASSTTSRMRLPTPEPQYLFATMAMANRLSLAALNAGQPTVQQYVSMLGGGASLPPDLDRLVRVSETFPGAIQIVDDFGKGKGDTIKFSRDVYPTGTYTAASRELATNATISTTGQTVQQEEVPVVLKEYVGPHDGTSVKPYAIWDFDAKFRANKEGLASIVSRYMTRDYTKWLDTVVRDMFRATSNITYTNSSAVSSVLNFTAGANNWINFQAIMEARKAVSDREWQPFSSGRYALLVPTAFNTQMVGDSDYRDLSKQHAAGRNLIFGFIGSVQDIDIFECSTLKSYAATDTVPGDGNAVPAGATVLEALMFGPGAVAMGNAIPGPELRFADDTNYGTVAKMIWYMLHAFQTIDTRGVQRILFQT